MSALERTGVWGWVAGSIIVGAALWHFVVLPLARATFHELGEEFRVEEAGR